jgi:hypothetical protein
MTTPTHIDCRTAIVAASRYGVAHHNQYTYSEGAERMSWLHRPPFALPWVGDCSSHFTYCYWAAGAPDPNGCNYDGLGYTGTEVGHGHLLMAKGTETAAEETRPGDAVIYFSDNSFTQSVHVAMITIPGADPMTISHGQQGDPNHCLVSQDGRPHRFYTFDTTLRPGGVLRYAPGFEPTPQPAPATPAPEPKPATPAPEPKPATPAPKVPSNKTVLKYGSMGWQVRWLQQKLGVYRATGGFGPKTKAAVGLFQHQHNLPVTGIVDVATWKALGINA